MPGSTARTTSRAHYKLHTGILVQRHCACKHYRRLNDSNPPTLMYRYKLQQTAQAQATMRSYQPRPSHLSCNCQGADIHIIHPQFCTNTPPCHFRIHAHTSQQLQHTRSFQDSCARQCQGRGLSNNRSQAPVDSTVQPVQCCLLTRQEPRVCGRWQLWPLLPQEQQQVSRQAVSI